MAELGHVDADFGEGFTAEFYGWNPDAALNPHLAGVLIEKAGMMLRCPHGSVGGVTFNVPGIERLGHKALWTVVSWEPLTITPSVDCGCCHGFITDGRWVWAGAPNPALPADTSTVADEQTIEGSDVASTSDVLGDPVVTRKLPLLQVEVLDDVHARINGELVAPGETAWVDGPCAVHLVMEGHAKIVGSE